MSSLLVSCGALRPFPDVAFFDIDIDHQVCGEYKLVDQKKLKFKWVEDHPLSRCNGFFALSPSGVGELKTWIFDAQKKVDKK